jgi:hypothetical protein
MPSTERKNLPKHLQFDYSKAKTLAEMDEIDGSAEFMRDLIEGGVYAPGGRLHGYEPVERVGGHRERITMSIPTANLIRLKMIANRKEIPYQTYLNSIIKEHIDQDVRNLQTR